MCKRRQHRANSQPQERAPSATEKPPRDASNKTLAELEAELPTMVKQFGDDSEAVGDLLCDLGGKLSAVGRSLEACDIYLRCIANYSKRLCATSAVTQAPKFNLAEVYDDLDQYEDARKLNTEVVEVWLKSLGGNHRLTLRAIQKLGETFIRTEPQREGVDGLFKVARPER
jgi:tetratricopeptide (TPR) repeat protein